MACCVLAALIISQVLLAWERCRRWLGLGRPSNETGAADWRPGLSNPVTAPATAAVRSPFRRRVALVLALQVSLGALLGLHWTHLSGELRGAGVFLGVLEPLPDPALCNVPAAGAALTPSRFDLAAQPRLAP